MVSKIKANIKIGKLTQLAKWTYIGVGGVGALSGIVDGYLTDCQDNYITMCIFAGITWPVIAAGLLYERWRE